MYGRRASRPFFFSRSPCCSPFWVGSAFRFALIGLGVGSILGILGLAMTRWESRAEGLFYTPSRWLTLVVTLAIAARFAYAWRRATHSSVSSNQHWLMTASGTELSLAVAAWLLGYYLVYSIGVRLQIMRHEERRANQWQVFCPSSLLLRLSRAHPDRDRADR
jgi:hypothetical protein